MHVFHLDFILIFSLFRGVVNKQGYQCQGNHTQSFLCLLMLLFLCCSVSHGCTQEMPSPGANTLPQSYSRLGNTLTPHFMDNT